MKPVNCSVIIPAYNAQATLNQCLDALKEQSVDPDSYEIIVIDDGSVDATAVIAANYGVRVHTQPNQGPAAARNKGAEMATGDLILFTDSDCVPDHDWIREMTAPFADAAITGVKGAYRTRQKELTARFAQAEFQDRFNLLGQSEFIDMVDTYSAGFRRRVFLSAGGFDTSFPVANNEDTEFSYRLASQGHKLVFNPRAIVFHTHPATLRKYLTVKFKRGYWRIIVYARYPDKAVKDSYTPGIIKLQSLIMACLMALLPVCFFSTPVLLVVVVMAVLVLASAIPFAGSIYPEDRVLALAAPFFVLLRSMVFACGSIAAIISIVLGKTGVGGKPSTPSPD